MKWYILQVYSGYENKIVVAIKDVLHKRGFEHLVGEILVPSQNSSQVRYGKKNVVKKKLAAGYVFLYIDMNQEVYKLIKSLPRVNDFVGGLGVDGVPFDVDKSEVDRFMKHTEINEVSSYNELEFEVGESLHITSGPFASFNGTVDFIDHERKRLYLLVAIFGRMTSVELEYHQVEKINS